MKLKELQNPYKNRKLYKSSETLICNWTKCSLLIGIENWNFSKLIGLAVNLAFKRHLFIILNKKLCFQHAMTIRTRFSISIAYMSIILRFVLKNYYKLEDTRYLSVLAYMSDKAGCDLYLLFKARSID